MAQEKIEILFTPKGDQALIRAIKELDVATKRLQGQTSRYEKELRRLKKTQLDTNKATLFGVRNIRNLGKQTGIATVRLSVLRSKLLIVSFGLALVTKSMGKLFDAMIVQENAQKKLDTALGSSGKSLANYAAALQKVTTFGDEEIINAQALIAAYTDDEEKIKKATKATLDLAAAKGIDLNTAADLVGKSFGSSTNALSRYGIEADGAAGSTKRLNMITQNIAKLYGGQATSAAETFGGQLQQMKNAIGDVNEAIGFAFAPQMKSIIKFLTDGSEKAREFFMGLGETDLETSVRQLEEMGANTDELRLSMVDLDLSRMSTDIKEGVDRQEEMNKLQQRFNEGTKTEIDARAKIAAAQVAIEKLENDNIKTRKTSFNEMNQVVFEYSDEVQAAINGHKNIIAAQGKTVEKQKESNDLILESIINEDKYTEKLQESSDLQVKLGIMMADVQVEARKKLHLRIIDFFEKENIKIGEMKVSLFSMTDEMAEKSAEILNQAADMATEHANQRISAIDAATNKQIEDEKKTRKFQRMSSKQQEDFEKGLRDKAEKDKEKAKKKENQIKVIEFGINQSIRLKEAIMNTAKEVAGHAGNPIMQAFTYAIGAAQVALIASQRPPKMAAGGLVGGKRHSQGGTIIEAEQGEFVMNRNAVDAIGVENLNKMNVGGGSGANITFSGNVMSDDFIENEAIPKIKEAVRRGSDIGVS